MAPSTRSKTQTIKAMKAKPKASKTVRFSKLKSKTVKPKMKTPSSKIVSAKKMAVQPNQKKSTIPKKMKMPANESKTVKPIKKIPSKTTPVKKTMKYKQKQSAAPAKKIKTAAKSGQTKQKSAFANAATEDKINLDNFITEKLGALKMKNENQIISDAGSSTLADMVKFNISMAHSFYNITDMDTLEVSLLALQPHVDVDRQELSPSVAAVYKEVAMYRDLLLLGDLPTITQERRPFEWISSAPRLSIPAQVTIMTSFITLAIKMTGKRPVKFNLKISGGKLLGKKREEVISYMAIMQTIVDSMSKGNNWEKVDKFVNLKKMENDFNNIIAQF